MKNHEAVLKETHAAYAAGAQSVFVVQDHRYKVIGSYTTLQALCKFLGCTNKAEYVQAFGKKLKTAERTLLKYSDRISYRYWPFDALTPLEPVSKAEEPPFKQQTRKLLILGHARHGKDTVAERIAAKLDLYFMTSSGVFAELAYDFWGYDDADQCFDDRVNHRAMWGDAIARYVRNDKARLARKVYSTCPIYVGVRRQDELDAIIKEFDPVIIWVDALNRLAPEDPSSFRIEKPSGAITLDNNGSEHDLEQQIDTLLAFRQV